MKPCVIIPTYNEEKSIGALVREIHNQNLDVIVVDDGSKDNTFQIARDSGATIIKNEVNKGKGASLLKGFQYALNNDYDAVITMDGDGQHLPSDIPYFMRVAQYSNSGIFIGNRLSKAKSMPLVRLITNHLMSWLISLVIKQDIPDTQCGFRLIKKAVLEKIRLSTDKYETESEVLIKASRLGFQIESVPIKAIYRGEKSQINPIIDTLRFMRYILKEIFNAPV